MPKKKTKVAEIEPWKGWGMVVGGGPHPYMAYVFSAEETVVKAEVEERYHKVVPAVVIPESRYNELLKAEKALATLREKVGI